MKQIRVVLTGLLCAAITPLHAQLTIETCHKKALEHYPLLKQKQLLQDIERLNRTNANFNYLPQVSVSGKWSYQSEVMQLPVQIPGIDEISKDQYRGMVEMAQTLWDGGITNARKKIDAATSDVDKHRLEVDLYALNERVDQLFFGSLLMEAQLKQNSILGDELQTNYDRFSALMKNGMANQSDLDAIKVEQLNVEQRRIGLVNSGRSFRAMLVAFIGEPIPEEITLVKPYYGNEATIDETINRPELALFDAQISVLERQKDLIVTALIPKVGLFGQWSLGRPGVNLFKDEFSNWLVGGIRLNWGLSGLYSLRNSFDRIEKKAALARVQKETFLFNIEQQCMQQRSEIDTYREFIRSDDEIITLRGNVKRAAEARVENGTISVADLIKEINAENLAIQARSLHEIQLLMSINKLRNTINR